MGLRNSNLVPSLPTLLVDDINILGGVNSPRLSLVPIKQIKSKHFSRFPLFLLSQSMPSMPGGDDKKEDDKAPETPEAKAEREQQVKMILDLVHSFLIFSCILFSRIFCLLGALYFFSIFSDIFLQLLEA